MQKFELSILSRPVDFKTGKVRPGKAMLVATRTVEAENVTSAVKRVRAECEGTGFIVVQSASLI